MSKIINDFCLEKKMDSENIGLFGSILAGSAVVIVHKFALELFNLVDRAKRVHFFSAVLFPLKVMNVSCYLKEFCNSKGNAKLEAGLMLSSESSSLLYHVSNLVMSLKEFNYLGNWSVNWADGLLYISLPLQVGWLIFLFRANRQTLELLKKIKEGEVLDYLNGIDDASFLKRCNIKNGNEFRVVLNDAKRDLEKFEKVFKKHIVSQNLSEKIALTSITVTLVASVVFVLSPISPIGYLLFSTGACLNQIKFCYSTYEEYNFLKEMKMSTDAIFLVKMAHLFQQSIVKINHRIKKDLLALNSTVLVNR